MNHNFHVLEFHKLLQILSGYSSCPLGKEDCLSLRPSTDIHLIESEQKLVSEVKLLRQTKGFFPFEGLVDIKPFLQKCRLEHTWLEPGQILSICRTTEIAKDVKRLIFENREICPDLHSMVAEISVCDELRIAVKKAIENNGDIKDSASREIRSIRRHRRELRRNLERRLINFKGNAGLGRDDDNLISVRDGRYVIPLRSEFKNRVQGIIHDYSNTEATCFFEPMEAIEDNNRLAELIHEERQEEIRILTNLSDIIREARDNLLYTQSILARVDGLSARARFSMEHKAVRPIMDCGNVVDLRHARNPILSAISGDKVIPVDIFLDREVNILIISGPNRGGKTVTLKTLGLLCLMSQSGIHIPVDEGSLLPVFSNILAEIGDDQDIQTGYSTFSAHIKHLSEMMALADKDSIIIIDEPGMGTDPDEGSALAMALLDDLSQKGALVAISTHYNRLKSYGLLNDRARNACVEFDDSTGKPTFSLRYGTPGTSYAFEVAREYGIDDDIVEKAKSYLDKDEVRLNRLIDRLNELKQAALKEREAAEKNRNKYKAAKEKMALAIRDYKDEKAALIEEKRIETDRLLKNAREDFGELINSFKRSGKSANGRFKKKYDDIVHRVVKGLSGDERADENTDYEGFSAGQWVRHKTLSQVGRIRSLDEESSKVLLMVGNIKVSAELDDLEPIREKDLLEENKASGDSFRHIVSNPVREVNLIGLRVEEALSVVDKVIDKTMVEGDLSLRIIHGYGTGRLKKAVREHLKGYSCVKKICGADTKSGGEAITIVELS